MLEKSNTKIIEIPSTLVTENHKIFAISKEPIKNLSTCNENGRICLSVKDLVM